MGRATRLPNAKRRKINLVVDHLTVKIFHSLKYKQTKQLTQLGSGDWIYLALEAFEYYTCQHDTYMKIGYIDWIPIIEYIMVAIFRQSKFI